MAISVLPVVPKTFQDAFVRELLDTGVVPETVDFRNPEKPGIPVIFQVSGAESPLSGKRFCCSKRLYI